MKRKSQQINTSILKRLKRTKSINEKKSNFKLEKRVNESSDEIVANILGHVLQKVDEKLSFIILDNSSKEVIKISQSFHRILDTTLCPEEHESFRN